MMILRRLSVLVIAVVCTAVGVTFIHAQDGPRGQRGPGGGPGGPGGNSIRFMPVTATLDADGDGIISAAEIDNAPAALRKLDKNGDGKLTEDEVRPTGPGGRGPGSPGDANPDEMVKRMLEFDKNGDGQLSKDEVPERMQGMFQRGDTNQDGFLSKDELRKLAETQPGGPGFGGGRDGGFRRPPSDR